MSDHKNRLNSILKYCDNRSVNSNTIEAFLTYINNNITLPCEVSNTEHDDGETYLIIKIEDIGDTMYGLTCTVKPVSNKRRRLVFALADLEATDKETKNYEILDDYNVWFWNSR
jgi:hypothetical protein